MDDLEHLSINQELGSGLPVSVRWRTHCNTNYADNHDGNAFGVVFSRRRTAQDSERSQLVSPALAQAVESSVAEIEAATFRVTVCSMLLTTLATQIRWMWRCATN